MFSPMHTLNIVGLLVPRSFFANEIISITALGNVPLAMFMILNFDTIFPIYQILFFRSPIGKCHGLIVAYPNPTSIFAVSS